MEQTIFNWAVAAVGALGGWILKVIWDMLREMRVEILARDTRIQDDLKKLDTKMHEDFVRRDDFKDAVREIKDDMKAGFASVDATLRLIFKKLDSKE
jgi:molybdenum cofactor biosynthesis enzyme MoaA